MQYGRLLGFIQIIYKGFQYSGFYAVNLAIIQRILKSWLNKYKAWELNILRIWIYLRIQRKSMPRSIQFSFLLSFTFCLTITAQTKKSGLIIADFGKVWEISDSDYSWDTTKEFKTVFDIMNFPESHV